MMPLVRSRSVKEPLASRVLFPLTERRFTYAEYDRFLDRLEGRDAVPLREFAEGHGDTALRHDVDDRLESALELARREHARGLRATYFVLHTAPYWTRDDLLDRLGQLQALGHEVGWHNDLVTLALVHGGNPAEYLRRELDRLRSAGIDVVGVAAHGSPWCHRLGFHNDYAFADLPQPIPGFPTRFEPIGTLADFGFDYDAYSLGEDTYFSDSRFDRGRRAHPSNFRLEPGRRAIVLTHPCHWDASTAAKTRRLARRVAQRLRLATRS
ncbi:MAG: hypothetical protein QOH02_225 [Gaiellaceae bacterium]|nr:hypothetical protein [Gaiellaceae bacterium]